MAPTAEGPDSSFPEFPVNAYFCWGADPPVAPHGKLSRCFASGSAKVLRLVCADGSDTHFLCSGIFSFTGSLFEHNPFLHNYPPPLPPKTFGNNHADPSAVHSPPPEVPPRLSPRSEPKNGLSSLSHTTLRRWIETPAELRLSSDASSKSGSSDQDRNDLSASESDERLPSPKPGHDHGTDSPGPTDMVLPTTYFSVDNCMTDTYRAKYHKPALYMKAEDHMSSGESDVDGRGLPLPDVQPPEPSKSRSEPGTVCRYYC